MRLARASELAGCFCLVLVAAWLFAVGTPTSAAAQARASSVYPSQRLDTPWPTQSWGVAPTPPSVDARALSAVVAEAFTDPTGDAGETRALVVVYQGRIVLERYAPGFGPETRFVSWSVAKSITQALVGVAAAEGLLRLDAPMGHPSWRPNDPRSTITWRQALQMTDGLAFTEVDARSVTDNDSALMLFGPGRLDPARYAASRPLIAEPGTRWHYSSGAITLVARALTDRVAVGATTPEARRDVMSRWMRDRLFGPLGMTSAAPEFDAEGAFLGGSQVYATARDYARFGYLYLRGGEWDGRRILPPGWVDFARTPPPGGLTDIFGASWWVTPPLGEGFPQRALIADRVPHDGFSAQGRGGQIVYVAPSRDLVIVRLGRMEDGTDTWNRLGDWVGRLARLYPAP